MGSKFPSDHQASLIMEVAATEMEEKSEQNFSDSETSSEEVASVCQFFLQGKCRFGDACRNVHEGTPLEPLKTKTGKGRERERGSAVKGCEGKKCPMRTAEDVINRIKWDEMLPEQSFTVGYLDRFLGLQEEHFSSFSWEDLAGADYDVLAIPQHRIQYFKYKTDKVWDKSTRMDLVFGSTGSHITILEAMENIDTKLDEDEEAERIRNLENNTSYFSEAEAVSVSVGVMM